jgi:hypothetical protein
VSPADTTGQEPGREHGQASGQEPGPRSERREHLDEILEAAVEAEIETGRREETVEQAERSLVLRVLRVTLGVIVVGVGISLLVLPGPGLIVIAGWRSWPRTCRSPGGGWPRSGAHPRGRGRRRRHLGDRALGVRPGAEPRRSVWFTFLRDRAPA